MQTCKRKYLSRTRNTCGLVLLSWGGRATFLPRNTKSGLAPIPVVREGSKFTGGFNRDSQGVQLHRRIAVAGRTKLFGTWLRSRYFC